MLFRSVPLPRCSTTPVRRRNCRRCGPRCGNGFPWGAAAEELPLSGGLTSCCGFGGLQECANPGLAAKTAQERCGESPSDYLVYCAMCRDLFARTGKRTVHLLDLFFPPPDGTGEDLPPVSWSEQRENRAALVRELRKSLWEEEEKMEEEWETLPLVMDGGRKKCSSRAESLQAQCGRPYGTGDIGPEDRPA